jgi:autophagy-related protein 2
MWFPSFLSFPISLPSLPSISLPANIQRRFLSFLLKKYLGRFVVASSLDVERVQAQIYHGIVELERLEINTEVCLYYPRPMYQVQLTPTRRSTALSPPACPSQ